MSSSEDETPQALNIDSDFGSGLGIAHIVRKDAFEAVATFEVITAFVAFSWHIAVGKYHDETISKYESDVVVVTNLSRSPF